MRIRPSLENVIKKDLDTNENDFLTPWLWIRIRPILNADPDPGGQKCPTTIEESKEFSCSGVMDVLF